MDKQDYVNIMKKNLPSYNKADIPPFLKAMGYTEEQRQEPIKVNRANADILRESLRAYKGGK